LDRNFRIVAATASAYIRCERGILKIRIHDGSLAVDGPTRAHLERRLDFALSSFGDRVAQITVRLSRDGVRRAPPLDRCDIEVKLRPRSLRIGDTGTDAADAIENAAERLGRSLTRALERERVWAEESPRVAAVAVVAAKAVKAVAAPAAARPRAARRPGR
jgi:ribosome-associated translation inhibitor RaiA